MKEEVVICRRSGKSGRERQRHKGDKERNKCGGYGRGKSTRGWLGRGEGKVVVQFFIPQICM